MHDINLIPKREILWNVAGPINVAIFYAIFILSLFVCCYGFYRRYLLWNSGRSDKSRRGNFLERARILFSAIALQKTVNRDKEVKYFHAPIFYGFLVLLFTTTMVFIDQDLGIKIYQGDFYLLVTVFSDLFGLLLIIGLFKAIHRRTIKRPDKLHNTNADFVMLYLLLLMCVQGFALEAIRVEVTNDNWRAYSFVANFLSHSLWVFSDSALSTIHFTLWWIHSITVFFFIAYIPYSKFFHLFTSGLNLYLQQLERPKGALNYAGDIEEILEKAAESTSDDAFSFGIEKIKDLSWKQILDLDSCTSCGRCQEVCPAYNSGKALSPKWLILDSRNHLLKLHTANLNPDLPQNNSLDRLDAHLLNYSLLSEYDGVIRKADNSLTQNSAIEIGKNYDAKIAGEVMTEDVFWSCTTCRACMEVCPVGIEHVDYIVDVRRNLALIQGTIPHEAQASLRSIETRGNPFGPKEDRANWTEGLDVRILNEGDETDVLYWVGCVSSFDKRKQKIAKSVAKILNAAGINWGILGNRECCTGDPARRLGDENLFQSSAKQNLLNLKTIKYKTIISNCPHCFNSLKNEYQQIDDVLVKNKIEILHHSEYILRLINEKKLTIKVDLEKDIVFHDPCYLGRYNDKYEEPRDVLVQIGRKPLKESEKSKEKAMCCGAGGGHYWMDLKVGERVNAQRTDQLAETGADLIATACPFCLQMIEDGVKLTNREDKMTVKDLAELVAESI